MAEIQVSPYDPSVLTVVQAQTWMTEASKGKKGAQCPCCDKPIRTVTKKVTSHQAAVLVLLHRNYELGSIVNVQEFVAQMGNAELSKGSDWGRLIYWDLLEPTKSRKEFKLCQSGAWFVNDGHCIDEKVFIRDGECADFDGETKTILDILGKKYDFNALSAGQLPVPEEAT